MYDISFLSKEEQAKFTKKIDSEGNSYYVSPPGFLVGRSDEFICEWYEKTSCKWSPDNPITGILVVSTGEVIR